MCLVFLNVPDVLRVCVGDPVRLHSTVRPSDRVRPTRPIGRGGTAPPAGESGSVCVHAARFEPNVV